MPSLPVWPVILTNADWQRKKGAFAKLAGKTGVGEAMTAAKAAFDKIDFGQMHASKILPADRDVPNILAEKEKAKAYYASTVVPARAKLKALRDLAETTAKKFKANKLVPSSATAHAEAVVKAADLMWMTLAGNSQVMNDHLKSFDEMVATKEKNAREETQKLDQTIANLEKALKEAAKKPTKAFWKDGSTSPHQRCRSMCNAIRNIPALKKAYWSTWQKYGDEYHKDVKDGDPKEQELMKKKIGNVWRSLMTFKGEYKKVLGMA
jgi:uncharacterized membrane protein YfbV (UPF0208 family)